MPLLDPLRVEVGDHHRHLEPAQEEQRQLAGHQAGADDTDLGDRPGQPGLRRAGRLLGPPLHQVEGVQAGAQLLAHDQVGQALVLAGVGGRPGRRSWPAAISSSARYGAGAAPEVFGVGELPAALDGRVPGLAPVDLRPVDGDLTGHDPAGPVERVGQEVGAVEQGVGDAELRDLRTDQHLVLAQGVLDDHRDGVLGSDQVGQQVGAAPTGQQTEEALRQGDPGRRPGHRPVVARAG